jgi:N-acetylglucosaminyldiphosphoundecaprenol N-acetyl-beta-D-mannosaminyltransferase
MNNTGRTRGRKKEDRALDIAETKGEIFNIPVFSRHKNCLLKIIKGWLAEKEGEMRILVTINPEHVMKALEDREYFRMLSRESAINIADGTGLVWAQKVGLGGGWFKGLKIAVEVLRGRYLGEVIPGVELMESLCGEGYEVGFLGGFKDRARRTRDGLQKRFPKMKGVAIGSEFDSRTGEIMKILADNKVKVLFVAYGMVRQEKWLVANRGALERAGVRLAMGVGRSFDYLSGDLRRAPRWVRKIGCEWLFSLFIEPKRWRRQAALVRFVRKVVTGRG